MHPEKKESKRNIGSNFVSVSTLTRKIDEIQTKLLIKYYFVMHVVMLRNYQRYY